MMAHQPTHSEEKCVSQADTEYIECVSAPKLEDRAALFLKKTQDVSKTFTAEEERRVLRKIDMRILPLILTAYFLQQLDKATLSYSSVFGITKDAHLRGKQYSWLGSILYFAQLVAQPAAAFLLVKAPTGRLISCAVLLWGSTLCIMASCDRFPSLLGLRYLLGTFESLIAPSLISVTQMWWRRREQTFRTSYWTMMNGVTYIVGSLFSFGLGHIQSHTLFPYQIIFLFCGLLTVAASVPMWFLLPDSPMEARFLTAREKVIAIERLRANQMGIASRVWRWDHVREVLLDLKSWCWFFLIICISIPSGGIGVFNSLIIKAFGYDSFQTILFNIPFGVIQIIAILGGAWIATKTGRKGPVIAGLTVGPIAGCIVMLKVPHTAGNKGLLLFGYYLISFYPAITPMIFAWQAQNTAGDTKRKCNTGFMFIGLCTGNIIGPLLYDPGQAPLYRTGLIADLTFFIAINCIVAITTAYLMFLNRGHAKRRVQKGKPARVIDQSMQTGAEKSGGREDVEESVDVLANDLAFEDLTDLKNEDFIYVY